MEKYFRREIECVPKGAVTNLKFEVAFEIVRQNGILAGRRGIEDSQGRAAYELLDAVEVASRAIQIADAFVNLAEIKGWILEPVVVSDEEIAEKIGKLESIRHSATWRKP